MASHSLLPRHKPEELRRRLRDELAHGRTQAQHDLLPWILSGAVEQALDHVVYFAGPKAFATAAPDLLNRMRAAFGPATLDRQRHLLRFSAELALRLRSRLPAWNLSNAALHPAAALAPSDSSRFAKDWLK